MKRIFFKVIDLSGIRALRGAASAVLVALVLSGCAPHASSLYKGLSEGEANRLVAFLDQYEIVATKSVDRDGIAVRVASAELARAARLTARAGLPRSDYKSLGAIFPKDGLISSPLEERARMTFAITQQIESMLADIDGVVSARVNVVMPEKRNGRSSEMPSAAVLIRHREGLETDLLVHKIRRLVASSVPGLVDADSRQVSISFITVFKSDGNDEIDAIPTDDATASVAESAEPESPHAAGKTAWWTYALGIVPALLAGAFLLRRQFRAADEVPGEVALTRF